MSGPLSPETMHRLDMLSALTLPEPDGILGLYAGTPGEVAFCKRLATENGYAVCMASSPGRYAAISPYGHTVAIIAGDVGDDTCFTHRWCYQSYGAAVAALLKWALAGAEGKPDGWHREPSTGIRRWGGEARLEYLEP